MKVYALVGKSGTGKSYQAINLCREKSVEGIIDDGLFIVGNDILAGISAKRQPTRIGAVKTAIFTDDEHKQTVTDKIKEAAPSSILIIGTSEDMVGKIAKRLELPDIEDVVYIESITTKKERETAKRQRHELGKHVIPVPTFQIKRDFSGYFVDPLKIFRGKGKGGKAKFVEKSVVRPTYSYLGDYLISDKVINDVVDCVAKGERDNLKVLRVFTENTKGGIKLTVVVIIRYGVSVFETAKAFQGKVAAQVAHMTAFNIERVNIEVRDLR